jgi:uncharacterized membrane protein
MKPKPNLLEPLLASLLTLDWEISGDSIRKFEKELVVLKKKLSGDADSKGLIELALPVCNYLRVRKGSASPASMQFLHEATRTLHLFRRDKKLGVSARREVVKGLLSKFQSLLADVQRINSAVVRATRPKPKEAALPLSPKTAVKTKTKKKAKTPVLKVKKQTAATEVLKVIASHKKGVELSKLRKSTGFADSTISGILSRAIKEGKVKRIGRGVYIAA